MYPSRLKRLFDEFGHRMLEGAWRGDVLMQRGHLTTYDLYAAVEAGYLVPEQSDGSGFVHSIRWAGIHFAAHSCFYRLTAKGWWVGVAIGASFEKPETRAVPR